jgi:hypothetical protein
MRDLFRLIVWMVADLFRSRTALEVEIWMLRQQINVLRRTAPKKQTFSAIDRLIFVCLYRLLPGKQGTMWGSADGTHFTLPNFTDTNRFPRAGGGSGPAVGTYQSNQNAAHTHTVTGAPAVGTLTTDNPGNHTHASVLNDLGHTHNVSGIPTYNGGQVGGGGAAGAPATTVGSGSNNSTPMSITNAQPGLIPTMSLAH